MCSRAAKQLEELGERANEAIVNSRGFREALGSPGRVVLVKDDKGGFARFAVALRVIKDEKDGEVKRSVVVMAINEEGHGDDFQDDGIDASMDTPDPKKDKSTSDTSNLRLVSRKKDEENENDDDMFGGFGSRKGKKGAKKRGGGGGGGGGYFLLF